MVSMPCAKVLVPPSIARECSVYGGAVRTDVVGESALAFALRWKIDGDERSRQIAGNLLDWIYFTSPFFQKDPTKANFGSLYWCANNPSLYSVNDCYVILSTLGTAALLDTAQWDEVMLQLIMSNFRTTGVHGFRSTLDNRQVLAKGWQHFWRSQTPFHMPPSPCRNVGLLLVALRQDRRPNPSGSHPQSNRHCHGRLSRQLPMGKHHAEPDDTALGLAGASRRPAGTSRVVETDGRRHSEIPGALRGDSRSARIARSQEDQLPAAQLQC